MTEPICTCEDHGVFATDSEACPICGARGTVLLSGDRRRRLSKFTSGALRHFPDDAGLELDDRGWTEYDALVDAVGRKYEWATGEHVAAVIATDPKGRFERTRGDAAGNRTDTDLVRAAYGHSVDISLEPTESPVPDELYHGTAPENVASILGEGLQPMSRQHVHLSESREEARRVANRHTGDPVILIIDAAGMLADGNRIAKRGTETYTTDRVPPEYILEAKPE
ncbi:RNA 2'-phosphotransferase [Natronococcus pandeyae]|uniref:Probable RNA 2'-phosphotransferase n=1 Tax=Natronococcus pandeyae TaxID=2055836 RepID=A0A8J8Q6H9_9EURY|nr:RNA 2'-phosphotransferase [Natronococcus pandeyae]TYL40009.1 RNA 2'-phosphotransferase [Natronococcus pandeyae]